MSDPRKPSEDKPVPPGQDPNFTPPGQGGTPPGQEKPRPDQDLPQPPQPEPKETPQPKR